MGSACADTLPRRSADYRAAAYQDTDYVDNLDQHKAFALPYKRLLILMAGVDAQKNLFGIFHDEPKDTRFISQRSQEQHFRFIHDDDGEFMLPLPDFQPVLEWFRVYFYPQGCCESGASLEYDWHTESKLSAGGTMEALSALKYGTIGLCAVLTFCISAPL